LLILVILSPFSQLFFLRTLNFFIDGKDLAFLRRFTILQNGKEEPLFRKGLERYQLGRCMIADGFAPEHAKELLEYATSVTYNGITYQWSESDITIRGDIPVIELKTTQ
jgi:hypothetical protein